MSAISIVDKLDDDLIKHLYLDKKMTTREIGVELLCSGTTVAKKLNLMGITRDDQFSAYKINPLQHDIIIGSILGDGSFNKVANGKCSIKNSHAENQKDYCIGKFEIMKELCNYSEIKVEKNRKGNRQDLYYFNTLKLPVLVPYRELSNYEAMSKLNENSLTIWFLDDGYTMPPNTGKNVSPYSELSACRFTMEEISYLVEVLHSKFGLVAKIKKGGLKDKNGHHGVIFSVKESRKLSELVKMSDFGELARNSMSYKLID